MENDFHLFIAEVKKDLLSYIHLKSKILRLDLYEKSSRVSSFLLLGLIFLFLFFFAVFFIFIAIGFFLGHLMQNTALGFGCVGLLYVLILFFCFLKRNTIQIKLMNLFLSEISKNDREDE